MPISLKKSIPTAKYIYICRFTDSIDVYGARVVSIKMYAGNIHKLESKRLDLSFNSIVFKHAYAYHSQNASVFTFYSNLHFI